MVDAGTFSHNNIPVLFTLRNATSPNNAQHVRLNGRTNLLEKLGNDTVEGEPCQNLPVPNTGVQRDQHSGLVTSQTAAISKPKDSVYFLSVAMSQDNGGGSAFLMMATRDFVALLWNVPRFVPDVPWTTGDRDQFVVMEQWITTLNPRTRYGS